jgi:hypothetical protein
LKNKVLQLIKEMNLAIFNENDLVDKQIIVLYPGTFNPMALHHKEEYDRLCRRFGSDSVYIVTDDMQDAIRKPLTFAEKNAIMKRHNVKNVIKTTNPYNPLELLEDFDPTHTVVIYAVGKDNIGKLNEFKRLTKYNKASNLPYKDIQNPYLYYVITNHVVYNIPSFGQMNQENIQKALGDKTAKLTELKSRFISIFGWFDAQIFNTVVARMNVKRGEMIEVKKKNKGELRPLHMITRKFWDKVFESVITEEIIAYHRSPKQFYKFNMSNVSVDSNRQRYGYGLYFSSIDPTEEYGDYLYTVKLSKIFLLDGNKPVEEKIVNKIVEALKEYDKKYDEVVKFAYSGFLFYKTLSRILGGDKNASSFLSNNGIDGLKRDNGGISKNWYDYILFNDDSITIEDIKYDKVYESVITEEVEQINEVATLPTGLLKEIEPVAIELFKEIADLIRLDSSFNGFKRILVSKTEYDSISGLENQQYITAIVNRWMKNEDYIKKYGEKISNNIKLQSVNIELGGSLDAKFSEISKLLQYCLKNGKDKVNAGIALEIEHLLDTDFDSEYELNNKINYTKFNSELIQFSTNSDEFSGGASMGTSGGNSLDKMNFTIYFTLEFVPFFVKIQLAKRGSIETSVDSIISEFVKKVFLPAIAHELIHYVQRVKEFLNSFTIKPTTYNRLSQDDPNFWKTYLSDTMEIGAHAEEFVEQMRSNFPMETDKSILKMLQYNEIPLDASDALKKYYNAFFKEMGNSPNDPVKKRFIKTVYQIIDKS